MRKLLTILILCLCFKSWSQSKKKYIVNPGQKISDAIPKNEIYKYTAFTDGLVNLKDGGFGRAMLNYNSLFGEMQFIDPKGDTLSLTDEKNIAMIAVRTDTFYYDYGCIEQLGNYGQVKLGVKRILSLSDRKKSGGLNQSGSGEIETFTTYSSQRSYRDLVITETLTFTERLVYYLGDRFNHFALAGKKSVLKIYGEYKDKVSAYLDENKTNFRNEEDLKKLCSFLQTLK
jgi:hypothetical protein